MSASPSTELIARSWQLTASFERKQPSPDQPAKARPRNDNTQGKQDTKHHAPIVDNVQKVIEDALRAAGLMK